LICTILDELIPASEPHACLIEHVPDRPGHDRRYAMDITKIRDELGWFPKHDLEVGLRKTIQWYLHNKDWVNVVLTQNNYSDWMEKNYGKRQETK
jgi:dTDP-glucose 4,6-dehydratase